MILNKDQQDAYEIILGSDKIETAVCGYAGTGKTTLCKELVKDLPNAILLAPT